MSLVFGAATTDVDSVADAASIQSLTKYTVIAWIRMTSLVNNNTIAGKSSGASSGWFFQVTGTAGNVGMQATRAVTCNYITTGTPLATLGKWICLAATVDQSAGQPAQVYDGDLQKPMAASAGTPANGSGAFNGDAGVALNIANRNSGISRALNGSMAYFALFNRVLSVAEMVQWQLNPQVIPGCVVFHSLGDFGGTGTQADLSGNKNTGTITGATVGMPLFLPRRSQQRLRLAAAASTFQPAWAASANQVLSGGYAA